MRGAPRRASAFFYNHHVSTAKSKSRLWFRRYGFLNVLESLQLLPAVFLCQCIRHLPGRHRHPTSRDPYLGRCLRSDDGSRGRPHQDPLGKIPSVSSMGGSTILDMRHTPLHHSRVGICRQTGMGLRDLHTHDDCLYRHQCALRSHARCDHRQFSRKDGLLVLPYVLRIRWILHSPLRMGSPLLNVQGQLRLLAPELVAIRHDSDSRMLLRALPPVLQSHTRETHHRKHRLARQRHQSSRHQQTLVASQRSVTVLQPFQHSARCHSGLLLRRHHRW